MSVQKVGSGVWLAGFISCLVNGVGFWYSLCWPWFIGRALLAVTQ